MTRERAVGRPNAGDETAAARPRRWWMPAALQRLSATRAFRRAGQRAAAGDWSGAEAAWRDGLSWRADAAAGWVGLAEALERQGAGGRAREALAQAAATAGAADGEPFYRIGLMARAAGDFDGALDAFQQALARQADHAGALEASDALAPLAARRARTARREATPRWAERPRRAAG